MPRLVQRTWQANPDSPGGRAARRAFRYQTFVPDPISALEPTLAAATMNAISEAERAVVLLNSAPPLLASLEVLARRLLRAESVASSRIEGLQLSQRRLARAEAESEDARDVTAKSVLGNIAAMEQAIAFADRPRKLEVRDLQSIHRTLLSATSEPREAGRLRTTQNWIGGNPFNPSGADFVPPPPEEVSDLLEDLCAFLAREDLPPVMQAAIAHAQFETIHPFADGNGRVGRALVHLVLRRRRLATRFVPPVSLVLAADARRYVDGLTAFREGRIAEWCGAFAAAVRTSALKASELSRQITALQDEWRVRAGQPRRDSSAAALIDLLPAHPVLTVAVAAEVLSRSKQAANEALAALESVGVVRAMTLARRNRAFEAPELLALVNGFEEELALPEGGGRPKRPAPTRGRR